MNRDINDFYNHTDHYIFFSLVLTVVFILIIISSFVLTYKMLPHQIPLYYSLPWGDAQMASLPQFAILPFISGLIALVNLVISWQLHESQVVLKRVLNGSSMVIALLLAFTALKIISIYI